MKLYLQNSISDKSILLCTFVIFDYKISDNPAINHATDIFD